MKSSARAVCACLPGAAVFLLGLAVAWPAPAQEPAAEPSPSFEVASVKKSGGTGPMSLRTPGAGRLMLQNLPLRLIITQAWGIRDNQIVGGPRWMATDRFTINAKAETNVPRDQLMLMLRSLLAERFRMKARLEKREMPVYVLARASADAPLGEKLRPSSCPAPAALAAARGAAPPGAPAAGASAAVPAGGRAGVPPVAASTAPAGAPAAAPAAGAGAGTAAAGAARPTAPPPMVMSGIPNVRCGMMMMGSGILRAGGVPITNITSLIGSAVGGTVVDRTGLTGTFDVELEFSMMSALQASAPGAPGAAPLPPSPGADGPSIFTAVRDLGLTLERRREATDILVIDSIEQPDED